MVSSEFTDFTFVNFTAGTGKALSPNSRIISLILRCEIAASQGTTVRRNPTWPRALPNPSLFTRRAMNFQRDSASSTMTAEIRNSLCSEL